MSSSSGSWLAVIILAVVGAMLLLAANEANHGYFAGKNGIKAGGERLLESFRDLPGLAARENKENLKPAAKTSGKIGDQKDNLGRRDRAELNELLEKVGK